MREPVDMDDWDADEPRYAPARDSGRDAPLFWPAWLWPLLVWAPLEGWHARFARDLPALGGALGSAPLAPAGLAWLATAFVPLTALAEAGFYGMLWAARGRRLPLLAASVAVLQSGVLELLALRVLDGAGRETWAVLLAGQRAAATGDAGALAVAFGGAGLLAVARCALFAGLQAGLVRCRWREAFAVTCGGWLASHVALWWAIELFRGRSIFG